MFLALSCNLYYYACSRSVSETMSAAKKLKGMLEDLECPVCFEIPRELPIPACPKGHIVCKTCRENVQTCPTCRADFSPGGVNTLAGTLIHKVAHKCKFSKYGCDVLMKSEDLIQQHEKTCPERTVRCPYTVCKEYVQIKRCGEHFKLHNPFPQKNNPFFITNLVNFGHGCRSYLKNWDGKSANRGDEFDLKKKDYWKFEYYNQEGQTFFVKTKYFATHRCFFVIVMMADLPEVAAQYMVNCKIGNEDGSLELANKCPVVSIEEMPPSTPDIEIFNDARCWKIPYYTMKNLFRFSDCREHEELSQWGFSWQVSYKTAVEVFKKC